MLTLEWIDGFDVNGFDQDSMDRYAVTLGDGSPAPNPAQGDLIAGRVPRNPTADDAGRTAWRIYNTGFGERNFSVLLAAKPVWFVHFNLYVPANPFFPGSIFYRLDSATVGPQVLLAFRPPGGIDVWLGGDGHNATGPRPGAPVSVYPLPMSFVGNSWYNFQLKVVSGPHGTVVVKVANVTKLNETNLTIPGTISALTHRWQQLTTQQNGYALDDYVIWSSDDPSDDFPGEVQVEPIMMGADVSRAWLHGHTAGIFPDPWDGLTNKSMIRDHFGATLGSAPDGDAGYVQSWGTTGGLLGGVAETYLTRPVSCFGLVQGVGVTVCARRVGTSGLDPIFALVDGNPIGAGITLPNSTHEYVLKQRIAQFSPTGGNWTDRQIAALPWGVNLPQTTVARLSAFFLEKVVDLSGKPFNCGGGSYAF